MTPWRQEEPLPCQASVVSNEDFGHLINLVGWNPCCLYHRREIIRAQFFVVLGSGSLDPWRKANVSCLQLKVHKMWVICFADKEMCEGRKGDKLWPKTLSVMRGAFITALSSSCTFVHICFQHHQVFLWLTQSRWSFPFGNLEFRITALSKQAFRQPSPKGIFFHVKRNFVQLLGE